MGDFGWGVLAVFAVALALAGASIFLALASDWYTDYGVRRRRALDELAIRRFGADLSEHSWWLSENEPARLALAMVAQHMMQSGAVNIDRLRDEWRRELAQGKEAS